ncbi:LacI family transcriptional regulator [Mycobacteroides abscessus subsp. bolletii]|nr:LacI family transcriptional regulator [Mycobacteroides abscessus subsp. bolletii]
MSQPKLSDVAALAGVSPTTVSRVLNNRGYLSEKTRSNVFEAMKTLGYRPNAIARSLQGRKSQLIGLVFPSVAHPFYGEIAYRLESHLADAGYKTILCNSGDRPEAEQRYLDMLLANQVDGVITGAHSQLVAQFPLMGAPLVTIDRAETGKAPNVRCDNYDGGYRATSLLLERGAKEPVHITSTASEVNLRLRGYRDALAEHGITGRTLELGFDTPHAHKMEMIASYLDQYPTLDAVFASNDIYAAMVLSCAQRLRLEVPTDLQVIGFDGAPYTRAMLPHLATVMQPIDEIAQRAVARLLHAIAGQEDDLDGADVLPVSVYEGSTLRQKQPDRVSLD